MENNMFKQFMSHSFLNKRFEMQSWVSQGTMTLSGSSLHGVRVESLLGLTHQE